MKQIVEQVMAAMKNGTPASAPAAASSCGSKVTAANYPLAESMADQIKTPTGKDFTSLSYEKVINGELSADDMRIAPETLEMQAQVAESVHREAFAGNLRRAAELIAVPDDRLLEIYNALRPYRSTKQELLAYCRKHIAKYAMPYDIEFREELPKTLVGKVAYRVLEDEEKARLAARQPEEA